MPTTPDWINTVTGPALIDSNGNIIGRQPNLKVIGATVVQDLPNRQNVVTVNPGVGWKTALDFNWTTPSGSNFSIDGPVSFGGFTFQKIGTANEINGGHASAGGGNGLNFQPTTAGAGTLNGYTSSARNAPGMWLPISQISSLASVIDWATPLRFWVSCTSAVLQTNPDQAIFAVDQNNVSASFIASYGYPVGTAQTACAIYGGGSNIINNDGTTGPTVGSSFIGLIELPYGLRGATAMTFYQTGSASWPAYTSMQASTIVINAPSNSSSQPLRTFGPFVPTNWGFLLMAERGTGNPMHVTYDRMRIDYYG